VVTEMKDVLCYSIDAESSTGRAVAEKLNVTRFPTLLFLEPDGPLREKLVGFLPPEPFVEQVQRIKKNEGTVSRIRLDVEETPLDLTLRWRYALKLRSVGDARGYEREVAFIRENDPEGTSIGSRTLNLRMLKQRSNEDLSLQRVYDFLTNEEDEHLVFEAWFFLFKMESHLADHGEEEKRPEHSRLQLAAARTVWNNVPEPLVQKVASEIVRIFLHTRERLGPDHRVFLVQISEAMLELTPEDPSRIAMHGVCLFTAGRKEEAIQTMHRAIEIDPENRRWSLFLAEFEKDD